MCQLLTNTIALRLVALSKKNNLECLIRQPCQSIVRSLSSKFSMNFMMDSCLLRLEKNGWRAFPPIQSMGFHWVKGTCECQSMCQNKKKKAALPIPTYEATTVEEAVNGYLEELCRINGQAEKFVFVSPTLISPLRVDTPDADLRERADALVAFLRDTPKG
ncbi:hypothetical protein TIFTF001_038647 [Ficus carica]|uniref:Uncharacterized protein n=1 Tax=Ficus carica TaxID=3494 RepID=A0AA88E7N5_FICCA|nr:hypothetical protein TIFTF001_038642 [Ficus carica]GMN69599.1 hypothetical protein TIFTF001_038647 [Ficus carica]